MHGKFDDLGRFTDPSLLILTSLADGPQAWLRDHDRHRRRSAASAWSRAPFWCAVPAGAPRLGPAAGHRGRRRPYEITAAGQEILAEQVATMQQIVRVARLRTATAWGGL